ncbi:MAG TPA: IPT/TIG domain-containing protein, partial [Chloroflexota bacterium]|nr:IPT/TIG domain-containing protein [Chloroflexota bacterium]
MNGTMDNVTSSVGANATANHGVYVNYGYGVQFTNTTIANDDESGPAGVARLIYVNAGDSLSLLNTIVASSTPADNCGLGSGGTIDSAGNNLDNGNSCGFTQSGDLPNTNPMVAAVAKNGGDVETAALLPGSPAIGAGTDNGCPLEDARGVSRPRGKCDIGSYQFVAAPIVSRLSPSQGPTGGGTVVTITGSNLAGATAVRFGSAVARIDRMVSASEIQVTSPNGSGTVDVTVTTAGGTSVKTGADHYGYVPAPIVSRLLPNQGPAVGGTLVTITGSNLAGATAVHFGSGAAHIDKTVSSSGIEVTAPKGSGTVDVTVTTVGGTSVKTPADHYSYVPAPIVSK